MLKFHLCVRRSGVLGCRNENFACETRNTPPGPQARGPQSQWTEVWPTQPAITQAVNRRMAGEGITLPPNVLLPPFAELRSTSTPCRARPFPSVRENRGGCVSREGALLSTSPARAGARARVSSVSVQSGGMRVRGAWENWGLKEARASGSKFPSRCWAAGTSDVFVPEASAEAVDLFNQHAATRRVGLIIPDKFEPRL